MKLLTCCCFCCIYLGMHFVHPFLIHIQYKQHIRLLRYNYYIQKSIYLLSRRNVYSSRNGLFAHIEVNIPANDKTVFYKFELFSCIDMTRLMVVFFMFPLNINVKKRKFSCETWNLSDVFLR